MTGLEPLLPAHARMTYSIIAPKSTHFRPATCAEVDCPQYLHGWQSAIDEHTDMGKFQADYVRKSSGRGFTEAKREDGVTVFTFHAGQVCFAASEHQLRLQEKTELYVIRDGDHRGNPRGTEPRLMPTAQAWVDDFGEHQETLADRMKEG